MTLTPDLVILGSGTTAFAAAQYAVQRGARVLMVEQAKLGGTCINWGCVPSKTLIHKAALYHAARRGTAYGLNLSADPVDCVELMAAKNQAIDQLRHARYQSVLDRNPNIEMIYGHGALVAPQTLQVGPEVVHCDKILIATGGIPRTLDLPGLSQTGFLNSYSALNLKCVPKSLVIIGGGVIALEMGQMFHRFGCQVTILERGERPLAEFDERLTAQLCGLLASEGLHQQFGVETDRVEKTDTGVRVHARIHGRDAHFDAEKIMLAVGTAPATQGIGLETVGIDCDARGFIRVDAGMQTTAEGVWAAGDVTGPPLIAPAGELEGEVAVENMLTGSHRACDHRGTPMGVFIDPEIAMVGLNAHQAEAAGYDVVEAWLELGAVGKAHVVDQATGGLLLWADRQTHKVLGAQALCPRAADLIHEPALAVRAGLRVEDLAHLVHVYPTISEGWYLVARQCLAQLECQEG